MVTSTDGVRLHVVQAGAGPPVILLHGFPEFWYSWQRQIDPLAAGGFSVLAPDLRGFHLSDKPAAVGSYAIDRLVEDVACLVRATGDAAAHIVGHDWGGLLAWFVAAWRPGLVRSLVIVNAPHPVIYRRVLWRSTQWMRSAYVPVFMLPWLPERLLRTRDHMLLRQMFRHGAARPDAVSPDDIARYVEAAAQPGGLTGGLNYYRANARLGFAGTALPRVTVPTLVVWGERDPALGVSLLDGLDEMVAHLRIARLPGVGHWVQHEAPDTLTALILSHLDT